MRFDILTLFPEVIGSYANASIIGSAQEKGIITVNPVQIRDFATDRHRTVDDTPYGGGAGMVLKIEPIAKALQSLDEIATASPEARPRNDRKVVVLSARGEPFTQEKAYEYSQLDQLILICGRYEGIDQRVTDHLADEEISVGPYVLAGGELPALTVMEATARLVPGVLGNPESLNEESFSASGKTPQAPLTRGELTTEYPQYTKPEEYMGWKVPEVLLSGNHEEIKRWRDEQRE